MCKLKEDFLGNDLFWRLECGRDSTKFRSETDPEPVKQTRHYFRVARSNGPHGEDDNQKRKPSNDGLKVDTMPRRIKLQVAWADSTSHQYRAKIVGLLVRVAPSHLQVNGLVLISVRSQHKLPWSCERQACSPRQSMPSSCSCKRSPRPICIPEIKIDQPV